MKIRLRRVIGGSFIAMVIAAGFCLTNYSDPADVVKLIAITSIFIVFPIIDYITANSRYSLEKWRWARIFSAEPELRSPRKLQFSLMRMLIATATVAIVFSVFAIVFTFKEIAITLPASVIALALGGLVLIAKRSEAKVILGLIALYFATAILLGLVVFVVGGLVFWFCGK